MKIILAGSAAQFEAKRKSFSYDQYEKAVAKFYILDQEEELLDELDTLCDGGFVTEEINNILVELTQVDNRISQTQVDIDVLRIETREMLAALSESVV